MPVSTKHKQYTKNIDKWNLTRDCVEGSQAIKGRNNGKTYLPMPNPDDQSDENETRYSDYKKRANFVNFTGHTQEGMLGMIYRKQPTFEIPTTVDYLLDNANGDGLTLTQLSQSIIGDLLETGRYGILTDYPQSKSGLTQAQVELLNLSATLKCYPSETIINWRTVTIGSVTMLSMVVLSEPTEVIGADGFDVETKEYHRVLLLDRGVYKQRLYDDTGIQISDVIPTQANGETWKEIPFCFVGSEENDQNVDKAPLYDIAEINIAHYRNSADFEESSYQVGQPTPVIFGLTQSWVDSNMKDGVMLGSRRAILLPEGGGADLLQANPNQMPERGMEQKEQQMVMIGARIIQEQSARENVESTQMRNSGQNSKLALIVSNTKAALVKSIEFALIYMGGDGDINIEFNEQFYDKSIDAQVITAQIMLLDRGVFAKTDIRRNLRKANMIADDRSDKDLDSDSEQMNVML